MLCALGIGLASLASLTGCSKVTGKPKPENDPLVKYQWHLKNTGQAVFSDVRPVPGVDLNMGTLFEQGITGKGVTVGLLDQGMADADHEDLVNNMVLPHEHNTSSQPAVTMHATAVAAIIAATAGNGKGGRGIAPDAKILDLSANVPSNTPAPRLVNRRTDDQAPLFLPYSLTQIRHDDAQLSNPEQTLMFKASGNSFLTLGPNTTPSLCAETTRGSGVGCVSAGVDLVNSNPLSVTVAAVNALGRKSSYSSTGSVLWVSGLGGEAGSQRAYRLQNETPAQVQQLPAAAFEPGIVTADAPGCDQGLHQSDSHFNALDNGSHSAIDPHCNYTARFNGTAAATPTVTGVAALMLQVNPKLSWWDIKYILASTAKKIDPDRTDLRWQNITLDSGWVTNAAGHAFSNWYGFGLVDATRAVTVAQHFAPLPAPRFSAWQSSISKPVAIPYRSGSDGYSTISLDDNLRCDTVQIRLKTTHKIPGNLRVALVSPSGTRSIVLPALTLLMPAPDGFVIDLLASNAFLDEASKGIWKLQVMDVLDPSSDGNAVVTSWQIRVLGRPAS